jgi:hypothetical protein
MQRESSMDAELGRTTGTATSTDGRAFARRVSTETRPATGPPSRPPIALGMLLVLVVMVTFLGNLVLAAL